MTSLAQEDSTSLETPSDLIDAPRNIAARNRQEALWAETNVDARQQLHMREAALAYKSRFQLAMDWYNTIKFMVDCGEEYAFHKLHPGLIELIVQICVSATRRVSFAPCWFKAEKQQVLFKLRPGQSCRRAIVICW